MDSEDRDHFKTIAGASAKPSIGSATISNRAQSNSRHGLDYCRIKATAICGCYRRDEAQDPDAFAAALAVVLADYPANIVEYAADPRTGVITKFPMGLPNVGQIKVFLDDLQDKQHRLERYEALPKLPPRARAVEVVKFEPNLFVPSDGPGYEAMAQRAQAEPDSARFQTEPRPGVWVPLGWWETQGIGSRPSNFTKVGESNEPAADTAAA